MTISTNRNSRLLEAASDRITHMIVAGSHFRAGEPARRLGVDKKIFGFAWSFIVRLSVWRQEDN